MFKRFGSRVTIVQSGGQLLLGRGRGCGQRSCRYLKQDGVELLLSTKPPA